MNGIIVKCPQTQCRYNSAKVCFNRQVKLEFAPGVSFSLNDFQFRCKSFENKKLGSDYNPIR